MYLSLRQVSVKRGWREWQGAVWVSLFAALLVLHARSIDAVCDDAYVSLRHARNLALHGAPVYNLGERVEGYTSPLWMLLSSALLLVGIEGRAALSGLGAFGGVTLILAVWRLWNRVAPDRPALGVLSLALVAASTPVAAWTSSGLETPLFAALVVLSVTETAACIEQRTVWRAASAGVIVAAATLTRPEGTLLGLISTVWLSYPKSTRSLALPFAVTFGLLVAAFVMWRLHYYGALLPNTFGARLSAPPRARIPLGVRYAWFTVTEMGIGWSAALVAGLLWPTRVSALQLARAFVALYVVYVVYVGGDFLDLFRFFVPVLPLAYVALVAAAVDIAARLQATARSQLLFLGLAAPAFAIGQIALRSRALRTDEPARRALWIEPLGWTKFHAIAWSDTGRFLHAHVRPGDTMASETAGALPYYAGVPNVDLFGLADREVGRHGVLIGARPGHQRFATLEYALSRRPTFMMFSDCVVPWAWDFSASGYACVEAYAPSSFGGESRQTFLADSARADDLVREGVVRRLDRR